MILLCEHPAAVAGPVRKWKTSFRFPRRAFSAVFGTGPLWMRERSINFSRAFARSGQRGRPDRRALVDDGGGRIVIRRCRPSGTRVICGPTQGFRPFDKLRAGSGLTYIAPSKQDSSKTGNETQKSPCLATGCRTRVSDPHLTSRTGMSRLSRAYRSGDWWCRNRG